jgi:hypothetical protein
MADGLTVLRHVCKSKTQSECTKEFFKLHPTSLAYVKVDGDGNCFFRSLSAYYELHPELSIDGVHDPTNFHELRQYIVKKLKHQLETREEIREFLPYIDNRPLDIILSELATTCIFDIPIFELMTERVSTILNINLNLYRVNIKIIDPDKPAKGDNIILSISESFYKPDPGIHANATISIFLASYHYGLIIPNSDSAYTEAVELSKKQKKSAVSKKDYISKKEQELINAAIANSMKNYNNEKVNNSNVAQQLQILQQIENNAKFAQQFQQFSINNKSLKKSSKPKVGVNPFISKVASLKLSPKASPNSYHSNVSSVVSNASMASPVGSFNRVTLENAEKELPYKKYMKYTKDQIHAFLDKHGTKYDKKDTKEKLYPPFLDDFMEDSNLRTQQLLQNIKQTSKQARKIASRKKARNARRASKKASKK